VLLAPVVAMASAWLLLDQQPNAAEAAGGGLLIIGVLVALRAPRSGGVDPADLVDRHDLAAQR
jgi:O-acetylserine/cysteine efflux transporter